MIELGLKAKDKITGFKGIITSRVQYITGCDQYGIVPEVGKDGIIKDGEYFDEGRIHLLNKNPIDVTAPNEPGGFQRDAPRR